VQPESIPRLADLQLRLLLSAASGVKTGGSLVYSVCTLTLEETVGVVRGFLDQSPGFRLDPFAHPFGGADTDGTIQIFPQEADSDAMFIARMIRVQA
jgi:16S rRNA (cytosine967-C5)-methyltransferase